MDEIITGVRRKYAIPIVALLLVPGFARADDRGRFFQFSIGVGSEHHGRHESVVPHVPVYKPPPPVVYAPPPPIYVPPPAAYYPAPVIHHDDGYSNVHDIDRQHGGRHGRGH